MVRLPRTVPAKVANEMILADLGPDLAAGHGGDPGIPDVAEAVTHHSAALDELMVSEDAIEGLTAFAQKRKPQWRTPD